MTDQTSKALAFQNLHEKGCFILPNPWNAGSAKLLQGLGFKALASTSAGFARSVGLEDYELPRDTIMAHLKALCAATDLPVSADLENGFGHTPEACQETLRLGAEAGLVGGSIEDFTGNPSEQYTIEHAKERIIAAVETARGLPFPFTLTARAENFFTGLPDLDDTIKRLQAYQEAGADVLYAPGLKTLADIKSVLASVDRPINILAGPMNEFVPIPQLAKLGVRRISLGSFLASAAQDALIKAGRELLDTGTYGFLGGIAQSSEIGDLMSAQTAPT